MFLLTSFFNLLETERCLYVEAAKFSPNREAVTFLAPCLVATGIVLTYGLSSCEIGGRYS